MYIADIHIHSKYSMATSRECDSRHLDLWARRKGIDLVGTGDCTHSQWRQELKATTELCDNGFYVLKSELRIEDETRGVTNYPKFIITGEISCIYKKKGRTRKVHNIVVFPHLEAAEKLSQRLEKIGNIHSDGRPILKVDSRDLLEMTLDVCPSAMLIPAHIWTPHFSVFGAFSRFESIEECYGDMSREIHALETGLSSDPSMNRGISALDRFTLISNSDAHSPSKLGREANVLDGELSYNGLKKAIETGDGFLSTIEYFPQEGKYFMDGHRNCNIVLSPDDTDKYGGICSVCGKKLTVGVSHRIAHMTDREGEVQVSRSRPFEKLMPLIDVIGAVQKTSSASKKVQRIYMDMLKSIGPELYILRNASIEQIAQVAGEGVARGVDRLRRGEVKLVPGYDGKYGEIIIDD